MWGEVRVRLREVEREKGEMEIMRGSERSSMKEDERGWRSEGEVKSQ